MHKRVKRWTSKVDIFDKKYIVVPINESWVRFRWTFLRGHAHTARSSVRLHWYLAVIYNPAAILQEGYEVEGDVEEDSLPKRSGHVLDLVSSDVEEEPDPKRSMTPETPPVQVDSLEQSRAGDKDTDSSTESPVAAEPQLPPDGDQMEVDSVVQQDTRTEGNGDSLMANADESPQAESESPVEPPPTKGMFQVFKEGIFDTMQSGFGTIQNMIRPAAEGDGEPEKPAGVDGDMEEDEPAGPAAEVEGDTKAKTEPPFEIDPK
jgi:hypothetical protein